MFQINRKEYLNMIDALGGFLAVLETEREMQQFMADHSETNFTGIAGAALRSGMKTFLSYGVYEKAYQQSKKMKGSMESLLPLVNKLLMVADTLDQYLITDTAAYTITPFSVPYVQAENEIFMLNEGYANYLEQQCEDLVEKGKILKGQMQDAINKCSGIIDCAAEQTAINEAYDSVMRIENFKQAFRSYVMGVRDLDESLRLDFQAYTDVEVVEAGKALKEAMHENFGEEINVIRIKEILQKPKEEWTEKERILVEEYFDVTENKTTSGLCEKIGKPLNGWLQLYSDKTVFEEGRIVTIPSETETSKWAMREGRNTINYYALKEIEGINEVIVGANGELLDKDGRYWVAVGPIVMNPNHKETEVCSAAEMKYGTLIDVVVENEMGEQFVIPCIVGDCKAHTYPNGIYQTGDAFPNGQDSHPQNNDGSIIEFCGKASIEGLTEYSIVEIIVYDLEQ